jgi:F-type H+-transporting ATPase subunit gamma
MARTREIKGRIKAVGNIQRITKTMQMIATARFQAAQRRAVASQPYTRRIAALVQELAASLDGDTQITHPLMQAPTPASGRRLVLVITSNRGLCGGYNASLLRTAAQALRGQAGQETVLEVVGKKGTAYFKFSGRPVAAFHSQFADKPAYEEVEKLALRYMDEFTRGRFDAVQVVYMSFLSMARQAPAVLTLLPLRGLAAGQTPAAKEPAKSKPIYDFTPGAKELLDELLPVTVKTQLFQCFNEAAVGEQIARMVAMKSATDAAGKMKKLLTRKYNRARQTAITTELTEIIGGAAGLA